MADSAAVAEGEGEDEAGGAAVTAALQSHSLRLLSASSASMAAVTARLRSTSTAWSRQTEKLQTLRTDLLSLSSGLRRLQSMLEQEHSSSSAKQRRADEATEEAAPLAAAAGPADEARDS